MQPFGASPVMASPLPPFAKSQACGRISCQVALFLLSTGARLSEALNADWVHIDRVSQVWCIPATNSKSKRVRAIPLNDHAIEVLDRLSTEGKSEYLFTSKMTKGG